MGNDDGCVQSYRWKVAGINKFGNLVIVHVAYVAYVSGMWQLMQRIDEFEA